MDENSLNIQGYFNNTLDEDEAQIYSLAVLLNCVIENVPNALITVSNLIGTYERLFENSPDENLVKQFLRNLEAGEILHIVDYYNEELIYMS